MKPKSTKLILLILGGLVLWQSLPGAETVRIPGSRERICRYTDFFYKKPASDFLYQLNERLLFSEPPDEDVYQEGVREKLLWVSQTQAALGDFIKRTSPATYPGLGINLKKSTETTAAKDFLQMLGLLLIKDGSKRFQVITIANPAQTGYLSFLEYDTKNLEKEWNGKGKITFRIETSDLTIPWPLSFLSEITALNITADNFFETMVGNKRFSLLLATLWRLSQEEIEWIDNLLDNKTESWKKIYLEKKTLMGLFILSHALRVKDKQLLLPGGAAAEALWNDLALAGYRSMPFLFLKNLATRDDGKLNYLFLFSSFLAPAKQQALLCHLNQESMRALYSAITLSTNEKLRENRFPRLENKNFFSLFFVLQMENDHVFFPGGSQGWLDTFAVAESAPTALAAAATAPTPPNHDQETRLWLGLLNPANPVNKKFSALRKFITLYSKFSNRSSLLTPENLRQLAGKFDRCPILIDYMEKIPIQFPETLSRMIDWHIELEKLSESDRFLFSSLYQSLFELLAYTAKYAPADYDWDKLVKELIQIPFSAETFFDQFFNFLRYELHINLSKENTDIQFVDSLLRGVKNQPLTINDAPMEWQIRNKLRQAILETMQTQEICSLGDLFELQGWLKSLPEAEAQEGKLLIPHIQAALRHLPYPDLSDDAPRFIRDRVFGYGQGDLENIIQQGDALAKANSAATLTTWGKELRQRFLIYHLREYLLAAVYAINAGENHLRMFSNPNLVRLHGFSYSGDETPWVTTTSQETKRDLPGFFLKGGLSSLKNALAAGWKRDLFASQNIYNREMLYGALVNLLEFYPLPQVQQSNELTALEIAFAREMLAEAGQNKLLAEKLFPELQFLLAGHHYQQIAEFIHSRQPMPELFYSELWRIGRHFAISPATHELWLGQESRRSFTLEVIRQLEAGEGNRFGNIFYYTFGNLLSRLNDIFPQELAFLFNPGWTSGEMIIEAKLAAACLAQRSHLPPILLGQFLLHCLNSLHNSDFQQNDTQDFASLYWIAEKMGEKDIKEFLQSKQKEGDLRLK